MSWQIALLLFYVTSVAQALLQRAYSQRSNVPASIPPALSYVIGVTPLGIIVGLSLRHHIAWSWWLIGLLIVEGTLIGIYNWLSFRAIKHLPLGYFQTIYQVYELVVIGLGWVLLHERLNGWEVIGALLLLAGALLAIWSRRQRSDKKRGIQRAAVSMTVLAAISMGTGLVAEKAALRHMDIGAYFIFGYGTQTIALLVLARKDISRNTLHIFKRYDILRIIGMGILSAVVGFFYIIAITKANNISLITALAAFTLPLIALSSYVFLRERENIKFLALAIALSFAGLLVSAVH